MTCAHVLGLIDAGPFADFPPAYLDAAWQHARQCATCRPALEAATALTADLGALPQAAPPPDLAAVVMARIARIEPEESAPAAADGSEWRGWAAALGGLGAGAAIVLLTHLGERPLMGLRRLPAGLDAMPSTITGVLALAVGVVVYAAGLFASLGGRRRRPS